MFQKTFFHFFKIVAASLVCLSLLMMISPNVVQAAPYVTAVNYHNFTTIDVVFSENMDSATTATTSAYTLTTAASGDSTTITSASLQGDNKTVRLVASGAVISPSMADTLKVKTGAGAPENGSSQTQTTGWAMSVLSSKSNTVLLSEVQTQGGTATDEFVELYNASSTAASLSNYRLSVINSSGSETVLISSMSGTIPANGFYLITPSSGYDGSVSADATYASGNIGANSTVVLYDGSATSTVKDLLGFGSAAIYEGFEAFDNGLSSGQPPAHSSMERKAKSESTATTMSAGADASIGNAYDSNVSGWDFVLRDTANPQNSSSTAEPITGISNMYGGFDHRPLYQVDASSDLTVLARAMDAETPPRDLAVQLKYQPAATTTWSTVTGAHIANGFFSFQIPAADIAQQSNSFSYYLKSTDTALTPGGSTKSICFADSGTVSDCDSNESTAQSNAWSVNGVSAAGWNNTISGSVKDSSDNPIANALVFLNGTGLNTVSGSNGSFTLSNVYDGNFDLVAVAGGYGDGWINGISVAGGASSTGWNFSLYSGGGGGGGDMDDPWVSWSAPPDQMMAAPVNIAIGAMPILIGFAQTMDTATINTTNILLKKVDSSGNTTDVTSSAGITIAYDSGSGIDIGGQTYNFGTDVAVLYSATALSSNSQYFVELLPSVKDTGSNSLAGNRPGGGHTIFFGTGTSHTSGDVEQNYGTGGQFMPPYVSGTAPMPGAFNVALNSKINLVFSQAMDSSTISSTYIKLYLVSGSTETSVSASVNLDNNTKKIATIMPAANLAASRQYRVKVLGGCKSSSGIQMSNPMTDPSGSQTMFPFDFETGTGTDGTGPTVKATSLEVYTSGGSIVNVPVGLGTIDIGFSEAMDASTITTANITLKAGSTAVNASVNYDPPSRSAKFIPSVALSANTSYTLTVTTGVQDLAGNTMSVNYTQSFTTGAADTTPPQISYANADTWAMALSYNEPMRSVTAADTQRWSSSVLNPSNYTLRYGPAGTNFSGGSGTLVSLSSVTFSYNAEYKTVKLEGLAIPDSAIGQDLWVLVQNVTDLSGNAINASYDEAQAIIQDSQNTYGMMGPGDQGIMGPGGGGPEMGKMGMMGINVMPMNMMAGATTVYFIDIPLTKQIPDTGQIILTFPGGFGLDNAAEDPYSPMVNDINGPGPGTPIVSAVSGSTVSQTVTITLSGATGGTAGPDGFVDFLHMDVKSITNTNTPQDFNSAGYTVDIKTKNASGAVLESLTSMPFFINEGGDYTISGTITAAGVTNVASSTPMTVYLGSPMTGPMESEVTFSGSGNTQTYSFASLPVGDYHLFTKSNITLSADGSSKDFMGSMMPEPIWVPDTGSANYNDGTKTYTRNLTLALATGGAQLVPKIAVDFSSTTDANDRKIDIFAHSPVGFTVKTVNLNQSDYSSTPWNNDGSTKLYLPTTISSGTQIWMVGIGPAMPEGPMFMGSITLPDWIPPEPQEVVVTGGSPPTASPSSLSYTITQATHEIRGYVKDASDNPVPDAEVFANKPMGDFGMPMHTKTDSTNASFTLKVTPGTYALGVFKPGLPSSPEITVKVADNDSSNNAADSNTTADVYKGGGILVTDSNTLVLKVQKAAYTISGKVTDGTNPVAYAPVWAYNETTGAFANSGTNSSGTYVVYVSAGTWKVAAHIPGTGDLPPITVVVNATNCPGNECENKTIRPTVASFATVKGRVYESADATYTSGEEITNAYVWLTGVDSSANNFNNGINVSPDGSYSLKTPGGTGYVAHAWTPDYGELASITLGSLTVGSTYSSQDFRVIPANLGTFSFSFSATGGLPTAKAYIDAYNATNALGSGVEIANVATTTSKTLTLPIGDYTVYAHVEGLGEFASTDGNPVTLTSAGKALTFNLPASTARVTVSGRVFVDVGGTTGSYDGGTDTPVGDALVWFDNPSSAIHHTAKSNTTSGLYSVILPSGTYTVGLDAPGYSGSPPTEVTFSADTTRNFIVTANTNTISGSIYNASSEKVPDAWVWAEKVVSATDLTFNDGWAATVALGGDYELTVTSGYWWVHAVADGYKESWLTTAVDSSTDPTGQDLTLTTMSNYSVTKPTMKTIIPAKGGVVDDTAVSGIKLFFPPGALGTDTNNAKVTIRETYNIPDTRSQEPLGDKAYDVIIVDNSGTRISKFREPIIIEIHYDEDDLGSMDELQLTYGFIDDSNQWSAVNNVIDTTNNIIRASIDHLSATAPTGPSDVSAPATPATPSALGGVNVITVYWLANSEVDLAGYEVYRNTASTGTFSNVSGDSYAGGSFDSSVLIETDCNSGTCTWNDSNVSSGSTYYYKVSAFDSSGNYSASSSASGGASLRGSGGTGGSGGGGRTGTPAVLQPEALGEGALMKVADSDKVYVVKSGKRFWVRTAAAFEAAGYNWSDIQTVTLADLNARPEAILFKTADSSNVYLVSQGLCRHIPSAGVFESYGYSWSDIITVSNAEAETYPQVNLIKLADDDKVYVIGQGLRRHIPSVEIFESYGYDWAEIVTINATEMNTYGQAQLIKGIGQVKVYQIMNGKRHHIASPAVFNAHGFKWNEIMEVNDTELDSYPEDAAITE